MTQTWRAEYNILAHHLIESLRRRNGATYLFPTATVHKIDIVALFRTKIAIIVHVLQAYVSLSQKPENKNQNSSWK